MLGTVGVSRQHSNPKMSRRPQHAQIGSFQGGSRLHAGKRQPWPNQRFGDTFVGSGSGFNGATSGAFQGRICTRGLGPAAILGIQPRRI
jgi:hypothetical protein